MPVTVFLTGVLLGTERYSFVYMLNILVVAVGVIIASHGETILCNLTLDGHTWRSCSVAVVKDRTLWLGTGHYNCHWWIPPCMHVAQHASGNAGYVQHMLADELK